MKKRISQKITLVLVLSLIFGANLFAQRAFDSHKGGSAWRHWYGKANVGAYALFGDVSTYDTDPFNKLSKESRIGFSGSVGKWITDWGAAEFTYIRGNFYSYTISNEVHTNFNQYTIIGMVNFTQLIYPSDRQTPFYFYGKIGYGQIDFNATLTSIKTGDTIRMQGTETAHDKRVSEWLIPFGIGGAYNFDDHFALVFDLNYSYVHTDKLDGKFISSEVDFDDNKDSYASITIGIMYTFNVKVSNGFFKRPKGRRNVRWVR